MSTVNHTNNTVYFDNDLYKRVLDQEIHRGSYQRDLLGGFQRWSGGDLEGLASKYGSKYHESRNNLRARLKDLDFIEIREIRAKRNGKRILLVGRNEDELDELESTIETR